MNRARWEKVTERLYTSYRMSIGMDTGVWLPDWDNLLPLHKAAWLSVARNASAFAAAENAEIAAYVAFDANE